jgi:hypothetical protein
MTFKKDKTLILKERPHPLSSPPQIHEEPEWLQTPRLPFIVIFTNTKSKAPALVLGI